MINVQDVDGKRCLELSEIVMALVGPVQAVGETREDERRLVNMKVLTGLVDVLLFEINRATRDAGRAEYSMRVIGKHAMDFLAEVHAASSAEKE